jgi:alkylation response protein AidB-like acyl-CoA dehydrogenase
VTQQPEPTQQPEQQPEHPEPREPREHPLVEAARRLATELLEPAAAEVDATVVPRSHLDAIGAAGLLGVVAPAEFGGAGAGASVAREVTEHLAGADAATWFVQAQHHSPVRMLSAQPSEATDRYLRKLATGELIAGISFSHLRRFPQRAVTAVRVDAGWRFDGVAPWYTGWGLNDLAFVAGLTDDDHVVFAIVPAREGGGLHLKTTVPTAALAAARTGVLALDDVRVSDADVALIQPHPQWLAGDRATSANANPAIFGVARSAVRLLESAGEQREEPATLRAAAILRDRLDDVRARSYALVDDVPAHEAIERRLEVRAEALEVLIATTSALVAANAGPAMTLTSPAQRKAREALFLLVQAQTAEGRAATLDRWSASWLPVDSH